MHMKNGQPVDKSGLTEAEFLASYTSKGYPAPSLTADICVFRIHRQHLELLLVRRGGHPCIGQWATPGGFVNPNETADEAAARELAEETHVKSLKLEPIMLLSTPGRDPRGWVVSNAFVALDDTGAIAEAGDDAAQTQWFRVTAHKEGDHTQLTLHGKDEELSSDFAITHLPVSGHLWATDANGKGLAFDHASSIAQAWLTLPEKLRELSLKD